MGEIFVISKSKEKTSDKYLWLIHKKIQIFFLNIYIYIYIYIYKIIEIYIHYA